MNLESLLNKKSLIKKISGIFVLWLSLSLNNGCKKDEPLPNGKILYTSFVDKRAWGNYELFVMNSDGTNKIRLTDNDHADACASWSPDGSKIAFTTNENGAFNIYVANSDLTNKKVLVKNDYGNKSCPVWSRDNKIAFIFNKIESNYVCIINADGSSLENIAKTSENDQPPAWSPDGSKIAYTYSEKNKFPDIYLIDLKKNTRVNITENPAYDAFPSFSNDGRKIAFSSGRDKMMAVYIMNIDGSNVKRLKKTQNAHSPVWTNDDKFIVYTELEKVSENIYIINIKNGKKIKLTDTRESNYPSWTSKVY